MDIPVKITFNELKAILQYNLNQGYHCYLRYKETKQNQCTHEKIKTFWGPVRQHLDHESCGFLRGVNNHPELLCELASFKMRVSFVTIDWLLACIAEIKLIEQFELEVSEKHRHNQTRCCC